MLLERLEKLLTEKTLDQFQLELNENVSNNDLYDSFPVSLSLVKIKLKKILKGRRNSLPSFG